MLLAWILTVCLPTQAHSGPPTAHGGHIGQSVASEVGTSELNAIQADDFVEGPGCVISLLQVAAQIVEREAYLPQPLSRPRAGLGHNPLAGLLALMQQGQEESITTRERVGVGSFLQSSTSNLMCLAVAVAIPALFLVAYYFVLYPPGAGRQGNGKGQAPRPAGSAGLAYRGAPGAESSPVCSHRAANLSAPGLVLGIPRALVPVAQEARVDIADLGTDATFLHVIVSERSKNPGIWLLAPDRVPVGFLDTSQALLDPGSEGPTPRRGIAQESGRCVVLHRAPSNQGSWVPASWLSGYSMNSAPDAPFAVFVLNRTSEGGHLVAQRFAAAGPGQKSRSKFLLTVNVDAHGQVTTVNDKAGVVLATTEPSVPVYSPSGDRPGSAQMLTESQAIHSSHTVMALSPDVDIVLIVAAVLSAQKLHPYFAV